jgi:UDP-GlcNAc:undecaprenyl-phosphate/decaprenyl-phosphate GlcNAc-1-phosphate transferase
VSLFPLNLYALALASSFGATLLSLPFWRWWAQKTGLVDDPGHRKIHSKPVPLAGGLAVVTGLLLPVSVAFILLKLGAMPMLGHDLLDYGLSRRTTQLLAILGGAAGMVALGWMDDRWELKPMVKFTGQLVVAFAVAGAGIRITLFVPSPIFSYAITMFWILTVINAFNFMDNMNGLCAGLGAIAAFCFALAAAVLGQYLVAVMAFLMCGALAGFLPCNFPRASVFLGDAGSHLVGFMMAVLAILPHFYNRQQPEPWAVLCPLLILAVPLGDMAWVVILRWRLGQPFYVGDNNHWSHRLVRRGWSKPGAVLLIWLISGLAGSLAVMLQSS